MSRIEFLAGYYEWNVYIDGECFYAFGDGISDEICQCNTLSELENVVDDYINCMNIDLTNDEKEPFPNELRNELKERMIKQFIYHYGIVA